MQTTEAIQSRRAVKHYDPSYEMPEAEVRQLMELALLSPTSFNIQNWRFVVVQDAGIKKDLRAVSWDQAQVEEACLTILLCAKLDAHADDPARYWKDAPAAVGEMLVPMIGQFYDGKDDLQRDEAMRSIGIAAQTIMLAAKAMGYDSCPMIGFDPAKVGEIIGLPEKHVVGLMITVGKAIKPAHPRGGQLPLEEVVFFDGFPAG
ncbi:MAG: nitroreductase family protein [Planctomycetota bacterium]